MIDVIKLDNFVVGKYQLEVSAIKSIYWGEHENEIFDDSKGYFGIDTGTLLVIYTKRGKIPYFRNDYLRFSKRRSPVKTAHGFSHSP